MSLWKVPDEQTRELMEDFYRRILRGEPRAEALRQAQLEMKKKYPDPFYSRRVHLPGRSGAVAIAVSANEVAPEVTTRRADQIGNRFTLTVGAFLAIWLTVSPSKVRNSAGLRFVNSSVSAM
jgi:hypothetical protein